VFLFQIKSNLSVVGLDIQPDAVSLLQLKKVRKSWQIYKTAAISLPEGVIDDGKILAVDALKGTLTTLVKQTKTEGQAAAIALPSNCVLRREINLPELLSEKEYVAELEMHLEKYLPGLAGGVYFDYQTQKHTSMALIAAAKSDIVNSYVSVVNQSGLNIKIVDVDEFAIARAVQIYNVYKTIGIIDIGKTLVKILFFHDGDFLYVQQINIQFDLAEKIHQAIQMCYAASMKKAVKIDCIYLSGKKSQLYKLYEQLSTLDIKIIMLDLSKIFTFPATLNKEFAEISLISAGLALRKYPIW
jgi:type IV pilus assembly protein PilM